MSVRGKMISQRPEMAETEGMTSAFSSPDWLPHSPPPSESAAGIPAWFRACPVALVLLDPAGTVIEINFYAEKLLGPNAALRRGAPWKTVLRRCGAILSDGRLEAGQPVRVEETWNEGSDRELYFQVTATRYRYRRRWVWLGAMQESPWREENRRLQEQLHIETMITSLSTHFINLTADRIDAGIQYAFRILGQWAGADRISILQFQNPNDDVLGRSHEWRAKELENPPPLPPTVDLREMPWLRERVEGLHSIFLRNLAALPGEAKAERASFQQRQAHSVMMVPLVYRGNARGYMTIESLREERCWADGHASTLRVAGELLINALERKKTDLALQQATQQYLSIFENAVEGIYQTAPDGQFCKANPALATILGFANPEELMAQPARAMTEAYLAPARRAEFVSEVSSQGKVNNFESQVRRKDGTVIWISENARRVNASDGRLQFFEGMVVDITARKLMEERILHDALHDALTGMPNRFLFLERVGRALDRAVRRPGDHCAVLLLDLDRFKMINDSMGHSRGDALLIELGRRFERLLPAGATLARLGGDEFGFLLEDIDRVGPAEDLAQRLLREMSEPIRIEDQEVYAPGSIGIALGTASYRAPEEILRDADTALNRAKGNGKGCYAVFDTSMHAKAVHLLRLETDLRKALDRREFLLHYQPIINLRDRRLTGFEALVRWRHPAQERLVPPDDFIPVAEETGIILGLGKWVTEEAARQLRAWQDRFPGEPPLTMAVNVSGKQLEDANLAAQIRSACTAAGVAPSSMKLELTESALMANPDRAAEVLRELRGLGFQLSLDDFGTGYSSLSYLHRFPFHTLKIDRSFVSRLEAGNKEDEIIRVINAMAGTMGMDVVAEGIETSLQLQHLLRHGVGYGQGYFFSKPLDVDAADIALGAPAELWREKA